MRVNTGAPVQAVASAARYRFLVRRSVDVVSLPPFPSPLLPSTESRVLATHMGQVVVVVESERTSHQTVASALTTLESCPVVLPLLNKSSRAEAGNYYGYYGPEATK